MKYLLIIISFSMMLFSCGKKSGFEITGSIKNAKGKTIYLEKLTPKNIQKTDSAVINDLGDFIFDGNVSQPTFYMLSFSKNEFLYLLVDSFEKITVTADAKDLHKTYRVQGSEGSELLRELHLHLLASLEKMDSLGLIYRQYYETPQADSVTKELNKASSLILANEKEFLKNYITKNSHSMAAYLALNQQLSPREFILSPEEDLKLFVLVDSCLGIKYPGSDYVKALTSYLSQVKAGLQEKELSEAHLKIGTTLPEITLPSPDGNDVSLANFKGKYVLLDFWASWCAPCRKENPNLIKIYRKYHAKGFEIFQISLDKYKDEWIAAIKKDNLPWTHASDLKYWESPITKLYAIKAIPANFLLDKEGKIIAKNLKSEDLEKKLAEIIK